MSDEVEEEKAPPTLSGRFLGFYFCGTGWYSITAIVIGIVAISVLAFAVSSHLRDATVILRSLLW